MKKIKCLLSVLLGSALFSSGVFADSPVGSDAGNIEVTNSGQAVWRLPISVPPGVQGLAPNLNLSVSAEGQLGVGGLSTISRCAGSSADFGSLKPVRYLADDRYCLDGQPLVLISGSAGQSGSIYHTQIERFERIEAIGQQGNGPASFKVTTRSGGVLQFGITELSKTTRGSDNTVSVWSISSLTDVSGNGLWYEYTDVSDSTTSEVVLSKIVYGAKDQPSAPVSVELTYESSPDQFTGYSEGRRIQSTSRLTQITTQADGNVARHFKIAYEQIPVSKVSRVKTISECASTNECYRPSQFHYSDTGTQWQEHEFNGPSPLQDVHGRVRGIVSDINNDGFSDWIVAVKNESGQVERNTWLGSRTGFVLDANYALPEVLHDYSLHTDGVPLAQLVDVNSDGLSDVVVSYRSGGQTINQVYTNTGSGWTTSGQITSLPTILLDVDTETPSGYGRFADLNGDGRIDIMVSTRSVSGQVIQNTWLNTGSGWLASNNYEPPALLLDYYLSGQSLSRGDLVDVDGNGLVDIVISVKTALGQITNQTWLNTGTGWQQSAAYALPVALMDYSLSDQGVAIAELTDMNGDGYVDIWQAMDLADGTALRGAWLNTGEEFISSSDYQPMAASARSTTGGYVEQLATLQDVDGDGRPEQVQSYLGIDAKRIRRVFEFTGNRWTENGTLIGLLPDAPYFRHYETQSSSSVLQLTDINNDGQTEFLASSSDSEIGQSLWRISHQLSRGEQPGYLKEHINGLGIATKISYGISTDANLYTPSADIPSYPAVNINSPMILVQSIRKMDGLVHPDVAYDSVDDENGLGWYQVSHHYQGYRVSIDGRGSLGFASRRITDHRSDAVIVSDFYQYYPLAGYNQSVRKYLNGQLLSETQTDVAEKSLHHGKARFPYTPRIISKQYDPDDGELLSTTETESIYDDYGNVTQKTETISGQGEQHQTITNTLYENRTTGNHWLLGLPTRTEVTVHTDGQSPQTNVTTANYNDLGLPESEVLQPGHALSVSTTYQYNEYGNAVQTTLTSGRETRVSTSTYQDGGRFLHESINPLGHTTTVAFDTRYGKAISQINPNGLEQKTVLNDFGIVLREDTLWDGKTQSKEVALAYWCEDNEHCPDNAVYFVAALDDQGESPQTVYYDAYGRELLKKTIGADLDGNDTSDGAEIFVATIYDAFGRKAKTSRPGEDIHQLVYSEALYDTQDRVISRTATDGSTTRFDYDGLTVISTNAKGQISRVTNNLKGKPLVSIDAENNVTRYEYDSRSNLIKTIDPKGNEILVQYDVFGRKVLMDDPDMGRWTYEYDGFGNLVKQTDAKNQVTSMRYDALNRLIQRTETEGTTTWEYDTADLGSAGKKALGKLAKVLAPHDQYQRVHEYDSSSRPVKELTTIRGKTYESSRGYYRATSRIAWEKYPSGLTLTKEYDPTGFPHKLNSVDLTEYQDYLQEYYLLEEYINDAKIAEEQHKQDLKRYRELLLGEQTGTNDQGQPVYAGSGLEDQIKPYTDEMNRLSSLANTWQSYASQAGQLLNQHARWSQDYYAEFQRYKGPFDSNMSQATRYGDLADGEIAKAKPYQDNANKHQASADYWWRAGRDAFHAACKAAGWAIHGKDLAELAHHCVYGPTAGDGSRIHIGLGNGRKEWCVNPGNHVPSRSPDCREYHAVFSWLPSLNSNLGYVQDRMNHMETYFNNFSIEQDKANYYSNKAKPYIDRANSYSNTANSYANKAKPYIRGMTVYGAMTSNHGLVAELLSNPNKTGRYDGFVKKVEQYSGRWQCKVESQISQPYIDGTNPNTTEKQWIDNYKDANAGPFKPASFSGAKLISWDSNDDGKAERWYINASTQKMAQAEKRPIYKRHHCKQGELYVQVSQGEIGAEITKLHKNSPFFYRNYIAYQYHGLVSPINDLVERANEQKKIVDAKKKQVDQSATTYWEALAYSADGQIKEAVYGNGVESTWVYDHRGRTLQISAENQSRKLQNMFFDYDKLGNLTQRNDFENDIHETFVYDRLNRLTQSQLTGQGATYYRLAGQQEQRLEYDGLGNITYKSDVGHYTYGNGQNINGAGIHAVTSTTGSINTAFSYDANGNQTQGHGRSTTWSSYNKPVRISKGGSLNKFSYGPERQLIYQEETIGSETRSTRYVGGVFEETIKAGETEAVHHLSMGGHNIAVLKTKSDLSQVNSTHYLHQDHLESVVMITDSEGHVVERNHYDAFGKKRMAVVDASNQVLGQPVYAAGLLPITDRSYTDHRYLAGQELIHMKGRVYDPTFGRFLSADPHIQSPLNSQSLNRYSYVLNNPLSLTDPSGYLFSWLKKQFKSILRSIKRIIKSVVKIVRQVVEAAAAVVYESVKIASGYYLYKTTHNYLKEQWTFYRENARAIAAVVVAVVAYYFGQQWLAQMALEWGWATTTVVTGLGHVGSVGGVATALSTAGAVAVGAGAGAISGFLSGAIATGSFKGALTGGVSGAIFGGVNAYFGATTNSSLSYVQDLTSKTGQYVGQLRRLTFLGHSTKVVSLATASGISSKLSGGSFGEGFRIGGIIAGLGQASRHLRDLSIVDSAQNPNNLSGISVGVNGDGYKIGGGRVSNFLCKINPVCDYPRGQIRSPLGGHQGGVGKFGPLKETYTPGSFWDRTVEYYAGPHDMLNSGIWYDANGNINQNLSSSMKIVGDTLNYTNVVVASPFAASHFVIDHFSSFNPVVNNYDEEY